jgi:hypothetical protein
VTSDVVSINEPESNLVAVQASVNGRKIAESLTDRIGTDKRATGRPWPDRMQRNRFVPWESALRKKSESLSDRSGVPDCHSSYHV